MSDSYKKDIEAARKLVDEFKANLPSRVDPASLTLKSKLPFKAVSLREVFIHRMADLGEVAVDLLETKKVVPAFIIVRATIETLAMLYWLHTKMENVVAEESLEDIDDFLMKVIFGNKRGDLGIEAYNILTAINKVNKKFEGVREAYDNLSEFAHPNWGGTSRAYGEIDKKNVWLDLGTETRRVPLTIGLNPLIASLVAFKFYYNHIADILPDFIKICDDDIESKKNR